MKKILIILLLFVGSFSYGQGAKALLFGQIDPCSFPLITLIDNINSVTCSYDIDITDNPSALLVCDSINNGVCIIDTEAIINRVESIEVGKQTHVSGGACQADTSTGYFIYIDTGDGDRTYIIHLISGVIQSITECF